MKHTIRMLLIPEALYHQLMATSHVEEKKTHIGTTNPIEHTAKRVAKMADATMLNDDERIIHYQQEFKRYKKLMTDEQERPTNVQLAAIPEKTKSDLRDLLLDTQRSVNMQQPTKPTKQPTRRQRAAKRTTKVAKRSSTVKRSSSSSEETEGDDKGGAGDEFETAQSAYNTSATMYSPDTKKEELGEAQKATTSSQQSASFLFNREEAEKLEQSAMKLALQNASDLGIGGAGGVQILQLRHGEYCPIKGSNLSDVLSYHFVGRHQPAAGEAKQPPGYRTFINNAKNDIRLSRLLFPQKAGDHAIHSMSLRGKGMRGKGLLSTSFKKSRKSSDGNKFRFKPLLW